MSGGFRLADQQFDPAIEVSQISEHPRNVNEGDIGAIDSSMAAHGFVGGIIVQRSTGHILAGNHSYRTAVAKGATTLPGFWLDVDDDAAAALMVDHNHTGRLGRDDPSLLAALLADLHGRGHMPATYTGDDLDELLADLGGPPPPEEFPQFGPDLPTEHQCPRCGYEFSGGPTVKNGRVQSGHDTVPEGAPRNDPG